LALIEILLLLWVAWFAALNRKKVWARWVPLRIERGWILIRIGISVAAPVRSAREL
jgi:hypothetical protein